MLEIDEIMAILRTTIARLDELTSDAPAHELEPTAYTDKWWSTAAILAHLRACNDELGGAMLRILEDEHPAWTARSPRSWQAKSGYHALTFAANLEALRAGRADLLATLESCGPSDWDRTASVRVPPKQVYERSVQYYGDWLAQHEGTHLRELGRRQAARRTRPSR